MVGSEGTLGFISNVTYSCVPEVPHKVGHGEFCCTTSVVVLGAGCMTQAVLPSNFLHLLHLLFLMCLLACSILSAFVAVSSKAYDALHTRSTVVFDCISNVEADFAYPG
jgi:FAD/FMN-containing dehydrogenase